MSEGWRILAVRTAVLVIGSKQGSQVTALAGYFERL
jgi:hypothetical protein